MNESMNRLIMGWTNEMKICKDQANSSLWPRDRQRIEMKKTLIERMDEWMNEWMNKWMNEWVRTMSYRIYE